MLDRIARKGWYFFLDGYSGYNQISIDESFLKEFGELKAKAKLVSMPVIIFPDWSQPLR